MVASRQRRRWWRWLAMAIAAVAATAVLVVVSELQRGRADRTAARPGAATTVAAAARAAMSSVFGSESDFVRTRDELLVLLEANGNRLAPETLAVFLDNLRVIDQSIVDIAAAHADNPDHPRLGRLLAAACEQELELLRRAATAAETAPDGERSRPEPVAAGS